MTVIAWDGKYIAADRLAEYCGLGSKVTKLHTSKNGDCVIGFTGGLENGLGLMEWFNNGAVKEEWPDWQKTEDWCRLIIAASDVVFAYERLPYRIVVNEGFAAFGSGRDYALGAMAQGADAIEAVGIASNFCTTCGYGIDAYELETMRKIR